MKRTGRSCLASMRLSESHANWHLRTGRGLVYMVHTSLLGTSDDHATLMMLTLDKFEISRLTSLALFLLFPPSIEF